MACVPLPNEAGANNSPLCPRMTRKNSTYAITLGSKSMLGVKGFTAAFSGNSDLERAPLIRLLGFFEFGGERFLLEK